MKRAIILTMLVLCGATVADAETYTWTDGRGVVSFTDNPDLIPHKYRGKALRMKVKPAAKELEEKTLQYELTSPQNVMTVDSVKSTTAPAGVPRTFEGHLGGSQIDPAPPSMKQPLPAPLGDQPTATPLGMKQPTPAPLGDQPTPTQPGMKQPKPEPLGDQPKPTPLGMEQPVPAR